MAEKVETIYFGGGCFWCVEAVIQRLKGVISVKSGYAGGRAANPTYEQVSSGSTGHAEVIQIEFDPSIIGIDDLLAVFFSTYDPTTINRQGNDVGEQYRSVIFYIAKEQKEKISSFIEKLEKDKIYKSPIVTEVKPLDKFYEAEKYHQNYYNQNQNKPYCQMVINPKLLKLKQKYSHLLEES